MDIKTLVINNSVVKSEEKAPGVITFVLSTNDVDRDSEVLLPKGINVKEFKKNPILLWNHDAYNRPAIGKLLMDTMEITEEKVSSDVQFDIENDSYANMIYNKYKSGFLNSGSVRFQPTQTGDPIYTEQRGVTFEKWNLIEFSAVNIPANTNANAIQREYESDKELYKDSPEMLEVCKSFKDDVMKSLDKKTEIIKLNDAEYEIPVKVKNFIDELHHNIVIEIEVKRTMELQIEELQKQINDVEFIQPTIETIETEVIDINNIGYVVVPKVKNYIDELKAGRVLSKANEKKLRTAADSILSVLESVTAEEPKGHHDEEGKPVYEKVAEEMIELMKRKSDENDNIEKFNEQLLKDYNHLVEHYKEFDKKPPELQNLGVIKNDLDVKTDGDFFNERIEDINDKFGGNNE